MSKSNFYIPVVKGSIIKPNEVHKLAYILEKNSQYNVVLNGRDLGSGLTPAELVDKIKEVYPDAVLGTSDSTSNASIVFNGTDDGYTINSIMFKENVWISYVSDKSITTLKSTGRKVYLLPNTTLVDIVVKNNWSGYTIVENAKVSYMSIEHYDNSTLSPDFTVLDGESMTYESFVDTQMFFKEHLTKFELSGNTSNTDVYDTFDTDVDESNFGKVINHFEYVGTRDTTFYLHGVGKLGNKFLLKNVEFVEGEYEDIGGDVIKAEYLEEGTQVQSISVNGKQYSRYAIDDLNSGYNTSVGRFGVLPTYDPETDTSKTTEVSYGVAGNNLNDTTDRIVNMSLNFNKPVRFKVGAMEPFVSNELNLKNKMIFVPRIVTNFEKEVGQEAEWIEIVVNRPENLGNWFFNGQQLVEDVWDDNTSTYQKVSQVEGVTNDEQMLKHILSGLTNVTYRKDGSKFVARVEGTSEGQLLPRFRASTYDGGDGFQAITNNGSTDESSYQLETYSIRLVKA